MMDTEAVVVRLKKISNTLAANFLIKILLGAFVLALIIFTTLLIIAYFEIFIVIFAIGWLSYCAYLIGDIIL